MEYFEITKPYYALIKAENKQIAIEIYNEIIDEDDLIESEVVPVEKECAWEKFVLSAIRDTSVEELFHQFHNEMEYILLVDGSLI